MRKNALILAPHPDDESITGLLPLRLQEECGFRIIVVPVTWGSRKERQSARKKEFKAACAKLGFQPHPLNSSLESRDCIRELKEVLDALSPSVIFMPHAKDAHPTHQRAHRLGMAAMDAAKQKVFSVVETEYWHPLIRPNLMVSATEENLTTLCRALLCHVGEVARNDYAARLPAWMIDNVRRGTELITGVGASAPDMAYATLYRARKRVGGAWRPAFRGGRLIESSQELGMLAVHWI